MAQATTPVAERERTRGLNVWRSIRPLRPRDPRLVSRVGRAADEVVPSKVGEAHGRAAMGEIGRRGDEEAPGGFEPSGDKARIRKVADPERKVGPFGDQILVAIRHHEIDLEQRMLGRRTREATARCAGRHIRAATRRAAIRRDGRRRAPRSRPLQSRAERRGRERATLRRRRWRRPGEWFGPEASLPGDARALRWRETPRAGRGRIRERPWRNFRSRPCAQTRRAAAADHSYDTRIYHIAGGAIPVAIRIA